MHTVADLLCASCNVSLGWMYIKAPNGEQRYKEGESLDMPIQQALMRREVHY